MQQPGNEPGGMPPDGTPGGGGQSSANVSHSGATELTSNASLSDSSYSSDSSAQNALLVSGATVSLTNPTITKTGDDSGDSADFYGTNAAVFAYDDATLNITGGTITTDGSHANAVFAYDSGTINITNTTVKTSSNNSGGIMVTGGGTISAKNLTIATSGNSSAPIRSDRGGGTLTVDGGNYTSDGTGSPVIYSTADISVKNSYLTATASEGVVIEGLNSVTLDNCVVTDTNNTLNGNSETYKNVFIYQSMSGDAENGTGTFTAKNSTFITNQGDHFFITNTTAVINLTSNKFTNNDSNGAFLRAQTGKWGNSGSNGGDVTLNMTSQYAAGDIIIDSVSSLNMTMTGSYYSGSFTGDGIINLALDTDSAVVLTSDSYLDTLTNADSENSNIYANGHKLYVAGEEVSINESTPKESTLEGGANIGEATETQETTETTGAAQTSETNVGLIAGCVGGGVLLIAIIVVVIILCKKRKNKQPPVALQNPETPTENQTPETPVQ